ncbi:UPF0605 protein CG18335 [Schistocerca serialis cubense]|uniref:UPF0605 protein CG18335 n=1 Tax=Schistocerca serialis cubense TaxID=2023355 RepID=UPI00214EB7B9|nr:UPF0605 protein CG18335 [Schistocerca serialis cubense]
MTELVATAEPHHLPGYTGHTPGLKYVLGRTKGHATHLLLVGKALTVLAPIKGPPYQEKRPTQRDIDVVQHRTCGIIKYSHPMIPGYAGHVPGEATSAQPGLRFSVAATESLSEMYERRKRRQQQDTEKDCQPEVSLPLAPLPPEQQKLPWH